MANSFSVLFSQVPTLLPSAGGDAGSVGIVDNRYGTNPFPGAPGVVNLGILIGQPTAVPDNCFYLDTQAEWNPAVGTGVPDGAISFNSAFFLEDGTPLLDALNKWITLPANSDSGKSYSYWKMQNGYPALNHSLQAFKIIYDKGTVHGVGGSVENGLKISGSVKVINPKIHAHADALHGSNRVVAVC